MKRLNIIAAFVLTFAALSFAQSTSEISDTTMGIQQEPIQTGITSTPPAQVMDLSALNQEPDDQLKAKFDALAEEHASAIVTQLGIEEDDKEDVKEEIIEYLHNTWESRVALDQEKHDADLIEENNEDLNESRVELSSEIKDQLSDEQIAQWDAFKVEFWTNLDKNFFDIQQEAAISATASRNTSDEQQ